MADGWRVTGRRGTQELINGRLVPAMEVNVATDSGTEKQFIIPEANYTPERVKAIIDAWYELDRAVGEL
jgi:hypothetical protein